MILTCSISDMSYLVTSGGNLAVSSSIEVTGPHVFKRAMVLRLTAVSYRSRQVAAIIFVYKRCMCVFLSSIVTSLRISGGDDFGLEKRCFVVVFRQNICHSIQSTGDIEIAVNTYSSAGNFNNYKYLEAHNNNSNNNIRRVGYKTSNVSSPESGSA